jgi:hypothetical protein
MRRWSIIQALILVVLIFVIGMGVTLLSLFGPVG